MYKALIILAALAVADAAGVDERLALLDAKVTSMGGLTPDEFKALAAEKMSVDELKEADEGEGAEADDADDEEGDIAEADEADEEKSSVAKTSVASSKKEMPAVKLIKEGHECGSKDTELANGASLAECAQMCKAIAGCKYFISGTGAKSGRCFMEKTQSASCPEGWEVDQYNFYEIATKNECQVALTKCQAGAATCAADLKTSQEEAESWDVYPNSAQMVRGPSVARCGFRCIQYILESKCASPWRIERAGLLDNSEPTHAMYAATHPPPIPRATRQLLHLLLPILTRILLLAALPRSAYTAVLRRERQSSELQEGRCEGVAVAVGAGYGGSEHH